MSADEKLDPCGCGRGIELVTPVPIANPPALRALALRIGTQPQFKRSMLARLALVPGLRPLTARTDDDPSIALIDGWATVLDVLTFYQERFGQENFLRTATERRSILELARAIGYELGPGVSASTWLTFTMDTSVSSPKDMTVPRGTKVQSIPKQDQKPQLYETSEDLDARASWGTLPVKATVPFVPAGGDRFLYLKGVGTNLRAGDSVLVATQERLDGTAGAGWSLRKVVAVDQIAGTDPAKSYTLLELDRTLSAMTSGQVPRVFALRSQAGIFGAGAMDWPALNRTVKADYLGLPSPDDLADADLIEWPDWSIYAPTGAKREAREFEMRTEATVEEVYMAARQAAQASSMEAMQHASVKAQDVAASAGGAMASALSMVQSTLSGVFETLQASFPAIPLMTGTARMSGVPPAPTPGGVAGVVVDALETGIGIVTGSGGPPATPAPGSGSTPPPDPPSNPIAELKEVAQHLKDAATSAVSSAEAAISQANAAVTGAQEKLTQAFNALGSIASGFRDANLPRWTELGGEAMTVFKSVVSAARASASAMGAHQAGIAISGALDLARTGVTGPLTIEMIEDIVAGIGTTVEYTSGVANASMLVAASGMVGGTAAAVVAAGILGASDAEYALASEPTEQEIQALKSQSGLGDSFDAELGAKMLKLVKGPTGDGAGRVKAAVQAAVHAAKQDKVRRRKGIASPETAKDTIDLDNAHPAIATGGVAVLSRPGKLDLFLITNATETGRAQFLLSTKVTRLTLTGGDLAAFEPKVRETVVYAGSEELDLGEKPLLTPHAGRSFIVEAAVGDLPVGRLLALHGTSAESGESTGELAELQTAVIVGDTTVLTLVEAPAHRYMPGTLVVHGNVVAATHGETLKRTLPSGLEITEILGSGDGAIPFQKFVLKRTPLTYTSAATASGRTTSLEIRVGGIRWTEVPSFHGRRPDERIYTVRHASDGKATVQFGNGRTGARLPTGSENVTALYRAGLGLEGQVDAGQLSLLMSRPLGLQGVSNPLPGSGAADPESVDDARRNAPLTVLTLDRVVSLLDFEDFARGFAGIGKAGVTLLWTGEVQSVHLTVGLADGSVPGEDDAVVNHLRDAIDGARHAFREVIVQGYLARPFAVTARLAVRPDFKAGIVTAAATSALVQYFDYAHRNFAQDVSEAEVNAVLQGVDGVDYVDLDSLAFVGGGGLLEGRLEGRPARLDGSAIRPADLLTLNQADVHLTAIVP